MRVSWILKQVCENILRMDTGFLNHVGENILKMNTGLLNCVGDKILRMRITGLFIHVGEIMLVIEPRE